MSSSWFARASLGGDSSECRDTAEPSTRKCERSASISDSDSAHDSGGPPPKRWPRERPGAFTSSLSTCEPRSGPRTFRGVRSPTRPAAASTASAISRASRSISASAHDETAGEGPKSRLARSRADAFSRRCLSRASRDHATTTSRVCSSGSRNRRRPSRATRARSARGPCEATADGKPIVGLRSRYRYTRVRGPAEESRRTQRSST